MIGIHMHYSPCFITYFLCCTARLTACLPVCLGVFLKMSLFCRRLETFEPKNMGAALLALSERWDRKKPKRAHMHAHRLHQLGPRPVITSQTWRENFTESAVIDICQSVCPYQPQIKAESRRQGGTGGSRGGLRHSRLMSVKALISV